MNSCKKFRQINFSGPQRLERNGVHTGLLYELISFFLIFIINIQHIINQTT